MLQAVDDFDGVGEENVLSGQCGTVSDGGCQMRFAQPNEWELHRQSQQAKVFGVSGNQREIVLERGGGEQAVKLVSSRCPAILSILTPRSGCVPAADEPNPRSGIWPRGNQRVCEGEGAGTDRW